MKKHWIENYTISIVQFLLAILLIHLIFFYKTDKEYKYESIKYAITKDNVIINLNTLDTLTEKEFNILETNIKINYYENDLNKLHKTYK